MRTKNETKLTRSLKEQESTAYCKDTMSRGGGRGGGRSGGRRSFSYQGANRAVFERAKANFKQKSVLFVDAPSFLSNSNQRLSNLRLE